MGKQTAQKEKGLLIQEDCNFIFRFNYQAWVLCFLASPRFLEKITWIWLNPIIGGMLWTHFGLLRYFIVYVQFVL